ncbi:hypothetical protein O3P69_012093 [Scylla paramamosain]|uniref:Uncharacterized protein n=1 Tax=Scylla paramamosain TaxID=85552 RepID=A0AAW0TCI3_SCYPA
MLTNTASCTSETASREDNHPSRRFTWGAEDTRTENTNASQPETQLLHKRCFSCKQNNLMISEASLCESVSLRLPDGSLSSVYWLS